MLWLGNSSHYHRQICTAVFLFSVCMRSNGFKKKKKRWCFLSVPFTTHKTSKATMRYPQSLGWKKEGRRECHSYNPFLTALRMGRQRSLTKQSDNRKQHVTHSGNPSQAIPLLNHNQIRRQKLNKQDSEVTLNAPNTGKESFSSFAHKWPEHSIEPKTLTVVWNMRLLDIKTSCQRTLAQFHGNQRNIPGESRNTAKMKCAWALRAKGRDSQAF